jgi:methionyl-tRNA formyltransferase
MRIVFMGNPDFAVASLQKIHEAGYDIVAVVTGPDKPAGRGLKVHYSPVKEYALKHNLPVLQPEKLTDPEFIETLKTLAPDLGVVIAFRMLPEAVWTLPRIGTVNLHASLLPKYRGAAPINWAIINGEKETGLTTFFLKHEIDTGNIIFNEKISIGDDENAGSLHDRMKEAGAALMLQTVKAIEDNSYPETPQPEFSELKYAPKIFKPDCILDFSKDVNEVHNKIRGLSPYPTAYTFIDNKVFKIYSATKEIVKHDLAPGTFIKESNTLKVAVDNGFIHLLEVQMEGKKRMNIEAFLNGYDLTPASPKERS